MEKKTIKKIISWFAGLAIAGFLVPFLANLLSSGDAMNRLGLCTIGDAGCAIRIAFCMAVAIILIGALFSGVVWIVLRIANSIKWKNCIIPVANYDTEKPYIGATIENREEHSKRFFCVLKSIERNGQIDSKLTDQITKHTPRMSWSGGSDEDIGIKHIDTKATLNLVSLNEHGGLTFETAKGEVNPDEGTGGTGNYKLKLELNRQVGENEFSKMPFSVSYEFYYEGIPASQLQYVGARLNGPLANIGIQLVNKK